MNQLKPFEDYVRRGVVRKQVPDTSRSQFLQNEVEMSLRALIRRIDVLGFDDDSVKSIVKDCYDMLMEFIRAKMLLEGLNASGHGAHEAEVAYVREKGLSEADVQFLNDIRYFRNGIIYYGKILSIEYAEKVYRFTKKTYEDLQ